MKRNKIINWPNLITTLRFICIPFFLWTLVKAQITLSIILFLSITLGDVLDGFLAKKLKQQTYFGKLYDGITDTIFFYSTLITITFTEKLNIILLLLLILPRLWTFSKESYHYLKTRKITYDTSIYRKIAGVFIFILILISILKKNINLEALIAVIAIYLTIILERFLKK